jgi:glycosyltransferase involved in cell wall biosynthesis
VKVCFISCQYPPLSRTYRRYQFARLLAEGGCDVEVVAHGNMSRALGSFVDDPDTVADGPPVHRPKAVPWYLAGEALHAVGAVPCPYVNWVRPAVRAARRIARGPQDVVCAVYPPLTNLIAAWHTARQTGARLVVDFRDEYLGLASGAGKRRQARIWEARLRSAADLVSVATAVVGRGFVDRGLAPDRLHVTENGYWDLPADEPAYDAGSDCRIVYVGALSGAQGVEILCEALDRLRRDDPAKAARVRVSFYGPDNLYRRRTLEPALTEGTDYGGYLPAGEVTSVLFGADAGFLSLSSERFAYAVPGKLYDYVAHGRPMLASLPAGAAREIVERDDLGLVAPCADAGALAAQLARLVDPQERRRLRDNVVRARPRHAAAPHFLSLSQRIQDLPSAGDRR